jgi:hypothetical protein
LSFESAAPRRRRRADVFDEQVSAYLGAANATAGLKRRSAMRFLGGMRIIVPIILGVDHERKQVDAIAIGPITYDDIKEHLLAKQYLRGLSYKEFIDGRAANLRWNLNESMQIVDLVISMSRESTLGPTAVLVSTDLNFGMVRILEATLEDVAELRPFRDEQEARAWLGSK